MGPTLLAGSWLPYSTPTSASTLILAPCSSWEPACSSSPTRCGHGRHRSLLFALTFFFASLGQAFQDTHANTFVSSINKTAHRWLGFIHAMYMAGCLTGPLVATAVASADAKWNLFYIFPLGLSVVNFAWVAVSFWDSVALRSKTPKAPTPTRHRQDSHRKKRNREARELSKLSRAHWPYQVYGCLVYSFLLSWRCHHRRR